MSIRVVDKYRKRIVKEGILKSVLLGGIFGGVAFLIAAFLCWFYDYKPGLWIALALLAVISSVVAVLFYFFRYRPTVKQVARRLDELGLEERVLTMTELEGDGSDIARLQREDTLHSLGKVDHSMLKIAISAALIVPVCICCALVLGMATVSSLHIAGVIPSGIVTLTPDYTPGVFTVNYSVEEGGEGYIIYWTGKWDEPEPVSETGDRVTQGEMAPAVYAVPADDWVFVSWSDGYGDPYRRDKVEDSDIMVQAIFEPIEQDPEEEETEGDSEDPSQGEEGQAGQEGQEGEPQEGDSEGDSQAESGEPSGEPGQSGASGARDLSSQQIVDGQTYYGDQFDDAYQAAQDRLNSDSNLPDDLKRHIEDYFKSIETSSETGGSNNGSSDGSEEGDGE